MASRWICRILDNELGPLTFPELVELARSGSLTEDDPVRRAETGDWMPARDVVGLFRAARAAAPQPPAEAPVDEAPEPAPAGSVPSERAPAPRRRSRSKGYAAGLALIVGAAVLAGWWSTSRSPFPPPQPRTDESRKTVIGSLRAPIPEVPSVPGLSEGVPELVPGLERIPWIFAPSLSADLKTIVFVAPSRRGFGLFLADRADVSEPFGPPELIQACASPETESYPGLSPDALELLFVRSDSDPQILYTSRASRTDEFREPVAWKVPGLEAEGTRLGTPQFLDSRRAVFSRTGSTPAERTILLTQRRERGGSFSAPRPLRFSDPVAPYFLNRDLTRAYCGSGEGFYLSVRRGNTRFSALHMILDASRTGPNDGTIWVAPQEDVIFYCSPGPGGELGSGRQLWMLRY